MMCPARCLRITGSTTRGHVHRADAACRSHLESVQGPARSAAMTPPSIKRSAPVTKLDSGPRRNAAAAATSSGDPIRRDADVSFVAIITCPLQGAYRPTIFRSCSG